MDAHEYIIEYLLTHPCVDCNEKNPLVLQFDHINDNKRDGISRMAVNGMSLETIKKEIEKTEVRCANCHTKKTMMRSNAYPHVYLKSIGYL